MATTRSALVVVRLLVQGEPHHLLVRTGRLDGWSLVAGTLGPGAANWREVAARACEERLAPLRCGADVELVQLTRTSVRWTSRSISGTRTDHAAQVFALRLLHEGGLARVPPGSHRLVPDSQLTEYRDDALLAVLAALPDLPLAWGGDPPQTAPRTHWTAAEDALLGTMTDPELARELGVSRKTIERRRVELDIAPFADHGPRRELHELAGARYIDDYRAGVAVADIARRHGVSPATVQTAVERYLAREAALKP